MLSFTGFKPRGWVQMVSVIALVGALSACGGGDDPVRPGGEDPSPPPLTSVTPGTVAPPVNNPSTGFDVSGRLSYLVFMDDGAQRNLDAIVEVSGTTRTITFEADTANAFDVTTSGNWSDAVWPEGLTGALEANGNVGLICSAEGGSVGVSHNMVAVPSTEAVQIVRGKSFTTIECLPNGQLDIDSFTINADGTVNGDGDDTVSAAEVAAAFSAEGINQSEFKTKLSLYSYTVNGTTRYHIVEVGEELGSGVSVPYVILSSEKNDR